ncbi:MAG TPA: helix-turn-helix domain-containing protein [Acidimicrobiales bacterium]
MEERVEYLCAAPSPQLAAFVDGYVGYRLGGFAPGLHRGLPSRHMTFIVSIGPSIDVVTQTDPRQAGASYGCVLGGMQASAAVISHTGYQEGVAVNLTPLGSRALFGIPARALWNTSVECTDVAGPAGRELWERLQGPAAWADRFAACDAVLTRIADRDLTVAPELRGAWQTLVRSGGTDPIGNLAAAVGWSRQHLARRFRDEFGFGPKLAARVVRFERARHMLQATLQPDPHPPPRDGVGLRPTESFVTIAQVAAACGYYDQAHLDRDFADLAGCTPTAWLAEELPSFQDDAAVAV